MMYDFTRFRIVVLLGLCLGMQWSLLVPRLRCCRGCNNAQALGATRPGSGTDVDVKRRIVESSPIDSLRNGNWVKFICGASNQDVHLIRNLCYLYTLAGVDCIDMSTDMAVITAANEGISAAMETLGELKSMVSAGPSYTMNATGVPTTTNIPPTSTHSWDARATAIVDNSMKSTRANPGSKTVHRPYVMVSVNDDDDPHFRKAFFDPAQCPEACPRPCERVCPAWAIPPIEPFDRSDTDSTSVPARNESSLSIVDTVDTGAADLPHSSSGNNKNNGNGVLTDKCYGCGRCIPICPLGLIDARPYVSSPEQVAALLATSGVDAIEVHTDAGHEAAFAQLWQTIGPAAIRHLRVIAVSFPNMGEGITLEYLNHLYQTMYSSGSSSSRSDCDDDDDDDDDDDEKTMNDYDDDNNNSNIYYPHSDPCNAAVHIWQTDGRPMSGDIGKGTVHASVELATQLLTAGISTGSSNSSSRNAGTATIGTNRINTVHELDARGDTPYSRENDHGDDDVISFRPLEYHYKGALSTSHDTTTSSTSTTTHATTRTTTTGSATTTTSTTNRGKGRGRRRRREHYVQLAGGTNIHSARAARDRGLVSTTPGFGGFAFGGYARKTIGVHLNALELETPGACIEDYPHILAPCLQFATDLVQSVKGIQ